METKKTKIQKINQKIDSVLEKIKLLEGSKFLKDRTEVCGLRFMHNELSAERLRLKLT